VIVATPKIINGNTFIESLMWSNIQLAYSCANRYDFAASLLVYASLLSLYVVWVSLQLIYPTFRGDCSFVFVSYISLFRLSAILLNLNKCWIGTLCSIIFSREFGCFEYLMISFLLQLCLRKIIKKNCRVSINDAQECGPAQLGDWESYASKLFINFRHVLSNYMLI
jgi:hypothetical protein